MCGADSAKLTRDQEYALIAGSRAGDRAAVEHLVVSQLGFIHRIARRYRRYGPPLNDLVQEGILGLLEAIRRFEPERNVRLTTYSGFWVRAAIQDYILRSRSLVRVGTTAAQKALLFGWGRRLLPALIGGERDRDGRDDMAQALARRLRLSLDELRALARRLAAAARSPHADDIAIAALPDPAPSPEEALAGGRERRARLGVLVRAIRSLPAREREIIRRRFFAERKTSRATIGDELGLSKERVRQLEARALARLKSFFDPTGRHTARHTSAHTPRAVTQRA